MPRYKLTIEYDGTPFSGWQIQAGRASVQGALAEAVARLTGEQAHVSGAGRTDAGVHATGQVAHIQLSRHWPSDRLRDGLTAHLRPDPVAVLAAEEMSEAFDARFSARARHYMYRVINRRSDLTLERNRAWRVPQRLDADAMHAAAQRLLGRHDFSAFRAAECQASSPVRTLDQLDVQRRGDEICVTTSARSFLHHQVRSMVGSLIRVGEGRWSADDLADVLASAQRARCGPMAPACGLYLVAVSY